MAAGPAFTERAPATRHRHTTRTAVVRLGGEPVSRRPSMPDRKINLPEDAIPRRWYNVQADLPLPAPPLHPGTLNPVGPDDLAPLFPLALILQEVSGDAEILIPDEVREAYRIWRPTPLIRADRFEQALGLRGVRIYYK